MSLRQTATVRLGSCFEAEATSAAANLLVGHCLSSFKRTPGERLHSTDRIIALNLSGYELLVPLAQPFVMPVCGVRPGHIRHRS